MSTSPLQYPQSYTQEDIQQILQLAIAHKAERDDLTREQLLEIAAELDIDRQSLEAAETQWFQLKTLAQKRRAFDLYRRNQFKQKATRYLIVNTFLVSFNLLLVGTLSWSLYILLFWGLAIALNAWKTFQCQGEEYERAFQRWELQNEIKRTAATLWDKLQRAWQA